MTYSHQLVLCLVAISITTALQIKENGWGALFINKSIFQSFFSGYLFCLLLNSLVFGGK